MDALDVLCAQLTCDVFAIAKFLLFLAINKGGMKAFGAFNMYIDVTKVVPEYLANFGKCIVGVHITSRSCPVASTMNMQLMRHN